MCALVTGETGSWRRRRRGTGTGREKTARTTEYYKIYKAVEDATNCEEVVL